MRPDRNRTVLKYFAIFNNVAHGLEPREGPSNSKDSKLCTTFFNIVKNGEITKNFQFAGTGVQPHRNRK